jgi:dipeptidase E
MKLLLTSAGITNKAIENALVTLLGKPVAETKVVFIPTAANVLFGDKHWLIDDYMRFVRMGFPSIDIVDISALPPNMIQKRLEKAHVIVLGGGNTYHLYYWLEKSGVKKILSKLLETRVYVGISAGSLVTSKNLILHDSKSFYFEDIGPKERYMGLGFVKFQIRPHLHSPLFPKVTNDAVKAIAKSLDEPLYAIDDATAIVVTKEKVQVVTEGKYLLLNEEKR